LIVNDGRRCGLSGASLRATELGYRRHDGGLLVVRLPLVGGVVVPHVCLVRSSCAVDRSRTTPRPWLLR
jgi:hypothetical protein